MWQFWTLKKSTIKLIQLYNKLPSILLSRRHCFMPPSSSICDPVYFLSLLVFHTVFAHLKSGLAILLLLYYVSDYYCIIIIMMTSSWEGLLRSIAIHFNHAKNTKHKTKQQQTNKWTQNIEYFSYFHSSFYLFPWNAIAFLVHVPHCPVPLTLASHQIDLCKEGG